MQHTKGPWRATQRGMGQSEKAANARLIAAAPDLLAALQMVMIEIDTQSMVRNWMSDETKAMIRYAIAKTQPNKPLHGTAEAADLAQDKLTSERP